ncbi:WD40 repeat-like protein [Laetiporus sulphureus 93-53]|uniref:WD40 repeat-like protein n=1 Tax=Laetiporus sulphureus 93-53 TaxID=1314785 RepID=A0A165CPF8_9APHY|nr:WD40 repeat-like protein [Laetiporus sulphureus 93-53]KZT03179.1 WD40 repeat-like protein [Laetiporus sulphureus 93-53]
MQPMIEVTEEGCVQRTSNDTHPVSESAIANAHEENSDRIQVPPDSDRALNDPSEDTTRGDRNERTESMVPAPVVRHIQGTRLQAPPDANFFSLASLAVSPDGRYVAVGSEQGFVFVWYAVTRELMYRFGDHINPVYALEFSPDSSVLASSSRGWIVVLFDVARGTTKLAVHSSDEVSFHFFAWTSDGRTLASASMRSMICLWDIDADPPCMRAQCKGCFAATMGIAFSPDNSKLMSTCADVSVYMWDTQSGTLLSKSSDPDYDGIILVAAFSPDGRRVLTGDGGGDARIWSVDTGEVLTTIPQLPIEVSAVTWSPDGKRAMSACNEGVVNTSYPDEDGRVDSVHLDGVDRWPVFSSDGKFITTCGTDGDMRIWRVDDGALMAILHGQSRPPLFIKWSPDGSIIVTGELDGLVMLWDVSEVDDA